MELVRSEPAPPTFLDTLPALLFAVRSTQSLINAKHRKIISKVNLESLFENVEEQISKLKLKESEDPAKDITTFVKEVQLILESEESLTECVKESKRVDSEWLPFLHALLYSGLLITICPPDESKDYATAILQHLLPAIGKIWAFGNERAPDFFLPESDGDWLDISWEIICECFTPSSAELKKELVGPAVSILARMMRMYFPWSDVEKPNSTLFEKYNVDIRTDPEFIALLKVGVAHSDGAVRKQSLYVLKQTIKFCTFYLQPPLPHCEDATFIWEAADRPEWGEIWRHFFLLYESVQEGQVHILEPMIPLLKSLISGPKDKFPALDSSWWEIVIQRGLECSSANIRKLIISSVLEMNLQDYPRLWDSHDFLYGTVMEALDFTYLYSSNSEAPTMVSEFGMNVAKFYSGYLLAGGEEGLGENVLDYLGQISERIRSATPVLFLLQSLLLLPKTRILNEEGITLLKVFSRNNSLFHNIKARRLVRWQLLHIFINLANPPNLTFSDIASAITSFLSERSEQFTIYCREYSELSNWLRDNFEGDYIESSISLAVQQYFSASLTVQEMRSQAERVATMLTFTLAQEGGFSQAVRPLYQQMALIAASDTEPSFVVAGVTLFVSLNEAVRKASCETADLMSSLDVSAKLYEWISVCEAILLKKCEQLAELEAISVLLEGMNIFLEKAAEKPDSLIPYLDMLLYQLADLLKVFSNHAINEEAETYFLQLQKMVAFELMSFSFRMLERVGTFHLGFVDPLTIESVFSCELEKPPRLTDSQSDEWDSLLISFSVSKWNLISTISRFSQSCDELCNVIDIPTIFEKCISMMECSKYKSILAIFNCMRQLVALPNVVISATLINESIIISRAIIDEAANTPVWFYLYLEAFMDYFFQPSILTRRDLAGDMDSPAAQLLDYLLHDIGTKRKNVIARLTRNLYSFWRTPAGHHSRIALQPYVTELLLYGPAREEVEERLAHALTLGNHQGGTEGERREVMEALGTGSDYLVRVHMNSLLLHLDRENGDDKTFALTLIDDLLDSVAN